jgi:predicted amidohydrolase
MMVPTRAVESQVFIAYANQVNPAFAGLSTIADPFGRTVNASSSFGELITADIDVAMVSQARHDTHYLASIQLASIQTGER